MRYNTWTILLLFSFFSFTALANNDKPEDKSVIEFSIKPLICIVKKPGDACSMTATVSWQSPKIINSCLYQGITKVACWLKQNKVTAVIEINIEENMEYTLKDDNHHIIAKQLITINSSLAKKYRRRLRAGWSLF
ncbi:DUF3019 domain-containing protein [Colwellia psychrerythraea]|uniref:DUF3019 domain-containing protein n=1 Tax=Colwellia psychrerythraea TaxID=28229 RepID=A0A099KYD0_COLPS|nr:DUF3019 domain-containing protein [Colwellia psychrerythraea]KGJ94887.1 Protein of unknown function DUF3019 [Colwellia psychrerythraea]